MHNIECQLMIWRMTQAHFFFFEFLRKLKMKNGIKNSEKMKLKLKLQNEVKNEIKIKTKKW